MFCAISGTVPEEPVFSPKTGYVYEKRLVEKAVEATSRCPVTGVELKAEDLVLMKPSKIVTPRPPTGNSIPALLEIMANEWDTLMLETFEIRKKLQTTQEELARVLYERDAACRVIARLKKERDQARQELANLATKVDVPMSEAGNEVETMREVLQKAAQELSTKRRASKKSAPEGLYSQERLQKFSLKESITAHKSTKPGVLCVATDPFDTSIIATGGADGQVILTHKTGNESKPFATVATLAKHSRAVTDIALDINRRILISASQDKTALLWKRASMDSYEFTPAFAVTEHKSDLIACPIHPSGSYIGTVSRDGMFLMSDITKENIVLSSKREEQRTNYARFHPDGLLVGFACDNGILSIWDILQDQSAAEMKTENHAPLSSLSFSENGFYMATSSENVVQLWDLRKQKVFNTIPLNTSVKATCFDYSGSYFAAGDEQGRITVFSTLSKAWEKVNEFKEQSAEITGLCFGQNASYIAASSMDRSLCIFE